MKNKTRALTALILFVVMITAFSTIIFLSIYSYKLQKLVDKQNETLENYSNIDSILNTGQKDVISTLNEFFENAPTYVNGDKVSAIDFVSYHNRQLDSLRLYRDYYEYSQKNYGVKLKRVDLTDSTYRIVSNPPTRADSAEHIYPYFNKYLSINGNLWTVDTTNYEIRYHDLVAKYTDLAAEYKESVRKSLDVVKEYSDHIDSYDEILQKLRDDRLIELDTTGNDIKDPVK